MAVKTLLRLQMISYEVSSEKFSTQSNLRERDPFRKLGSNLVGHTVCQEVACRYLTTKTFAQFRMAALKCDSNDIGRHMSDQTPITKLNTLALAGVSTHFRPETPAKWRSTKS